MKNQKRSKIQRLFLVLLGMVLLIASANTVFAKAPYFSKKKVTVPIGQTVTAPLKGVALKKATWKIDDKTIATVSKKGVITGVKLGNTTVYATVGKKTYSCKVTVTKTKLVPMKKLDRYSYFRRYMSESELQKAYNVAVKIVNPLRGLSRKEQLLGIAIGLRNMFDNGMSYSMSSKHYNDPYGYLILKRASCAGCARTTGLCLNILGFKYEHVNENQYSHQWARVKLNGKYWICDAYGLYCGVEPRPRKHPYLR